MKHPNYPKIIVRILFPLLIICVSSLNISCKGEQDSKSNNQEELNLILGISKENKDFIKRLDKEFAGDGYTFSLIYPSLDESNISELSNSKIMLGFDDIKGIVSTSEMETKVRKFLGEEEWQKLRIGHIGRSTE